MSHKKHLMVSSRKTFTNLWLPNILWHWLHNNLLSFQQPQDFRQSQKNDQKSCLRAKEHLQRPAGTVVSNKTIGSAFHRHVLHVPSLCKTPVLKLHRTFGTLCGRMGQNHLNNLCDQFHHTGGSVKLSSPTEASV